MRQTIKSKIIEKKAENGQKLLGETSGWYSFRSNSNLTALLKELGKEASEVDVICGAKKRYKTEGTELLVFSLPE